MIKIIKQRIKSATMLGNFFIPLLILYVAAFLYPTKIYMSFGLLYYALVKRGYDITTAYCYTTTPADFLFVLYLIFIAVLAKRSYKLSDKNIGWGMPKRPWKILAAIGIAPALYAFQVFYYALWLRLHQHHWPSYSIHPDIIFRRLNYPVVWLDLAYAAFLSPIAEEILDRGVIQSILKIKLKRGPAVVTTSLLFVLFHYHADPIFHDPWSFLSLLGDGIFFGLLKEWDGSLWSPILAHQAYSLIALRFSTHIN